MGLLELNELSGLGSNGFAPAFAPPVPPPSAGGGTIARQAQSYRGPIYGPPAVAQGGSWRAPTLVEQARADLEATRARARAAPLSAQAQARHDAAMVAHRVRWEAQDVRRAQAARRRADMALLIRRQRRARERTQGTFEQRALRGDLGVHARAYVVELRQRRAAAAWAARERAIHMRSRAAVPWRDRNRELVPGAIPYGQGLLPSDPR
jgi:hypothetical protein